MVPVGGTHWKPERATLRAFDLARAECRRSSSELLPERTNFAHSGNRQAAAAVDRLRDDRRTPPPRLLGSICVAPVTPTGTSTFAVEARVRTSDDFHNEDRLSLAPAMVVRSGSHFCDKSLSATASCGIASALSARADRLAPEHALILLYGHRRQMGNHFVNSLLWLALWLSASAQWRPSLQANSIALRPNLAGLRVRALSFRSRPRGSYVLG